MPSGGAEASRIFKAPERENSNRYQREMMDPVFFDEEGEISSGEGKEEEEEEEAERKRLESIAQTITTVHVIFMNHLDVGTKVLSRLKSSMELKFYKYTLGYNGIYPEIGFAYNVINKYFDIYFPAAINTSLYLRSLGSNSFLFCTICFCFHTIQCVYSY